MDQTDRETLSVVEAHARSLHAGHDPAHDVAHVMRVVGNARRIVEEEHAGGSELDEFVIYAACWLHDAVQLPKNSGQPGESARRSADLAARYLLQLGIDEQRSAHVAAAVQTHSYSGGERPATPEAGIVQDADRLDALGAVGLARMFAVAGTLESALYHPDDPLGESRQLEDARYALDHIPAKLVKLPELMNTAAGRRIAQDRVAYLLSFRDQFIQEIGG